MFPRSDDANPEVDAVLSAAAKLFYLEERRDGANQDDSGRKAKERAFQGYVRLREINQPELLGKSVTAGMYEVIGKAIREAQVQENTFREIFEEDRKRF